MFLVFHCNVHAPEREQRVEPPEGQSIVLCAYLASQIRSRDRDCRYPACWDVARGQERHRLERYVHKPRIPNVFQSQRRNTRDGCASRNDGDRESSDGTFSLDPLLRSRLGFAPFACGGRTARAEQAAAVAQEKEEQAAKGLLLEKATQRHLNAHLDLQAQEAHNSSHAIQLEAARLQWEHLAGQTAKNEQLLNEKELRAAMASQEESDARREDRGNPGTHTGIRFFLRSLSCPELLLVEQLLIVCGLSR